MSKFTEKSTGVFVTVDDIITINIEDIAFIKEQTFVLPRRRARICLHKNDDLTHEMLIAFRADTILMPHRHIGTSKSYHVIEGCADIVIFSDTGSIVQVIPVAIFSNDTFYFRIQENLYFTILFNSAYLVIHEITNGPFDPEIVRYAPFAPSENEIEPAKKYLEHLRHLIDKKCKNS